jgi:hypothetical protein
MLEYTHEERRRQTSNRPDEQHISGCVERISVRNSWIEAQAVFCGKKPGLCI